MCFVGCVDVWIIILINIIDYVGGVVLFLVVYVCGWMLYVGDGVVSFILG